LTLNSILFVIALCSNIDYERVNYELRLERGPGEAG